jgi:hypothetical protein
MTSTCRIIFASHNLPKNPAKSNIFIENAHTDVITCTFENNQLTIQLNNSMVIGRNEKDIRKGLTGYLKG